MKYKKSWPMPYWLGAVGLGAALALMPLVLPGNRYLMYLLFSFLVNATLAQAWHYTGGFAGQVSFGGAAFFGIGGYVAAAMLGSGNSPALAIPAGMVLGALFSLLIGYPCFRLEGPYFTIATLGVGEFCRVLVRNLRGFSGGSMGLSIDPGRALSSTGCYYGALVLFVASLLGALWLRRSSLGLRVLATSDDSAAAESIGVDTTLMKLLMHLITGAFIGGAGAVYAQYTLFVVPDAVFGFSVSISMVLMSVVGGLGGAWGPVLGAALLVLIRDYVLSSIPQFHLLIYGALLMVVMILEPGGLVGLARRLLKNRELGG